MRVRGGGFRLGSFERGMGFGCCCGWLLLLPSCRARLWLFPSQAEQMAGERYGGFHTKDAGAQLDDATTSQTRLVDFVSGPSTFWTDRHLPRCIWIISTGRDLLHEVSRGDRGGFGLFGKRRMEHQSPVGGERRLFQPMVPIDRLSDFHEAVATTLFGRFDGRPMESPCRLVTGLCHTALSGQRGQSLNPPLHDAFDHLLLPVSLGEGHQQMHLGGQILGIKARGWYEHLKSSAVDLLHGAFTFPALSIEDHKPVAGAQTQDSDRMSGFFPLQENLT